ncbi:MAG TPA: hypothetical protein VFS36_15765 [Chitinophagaceae bacterium]|jgi:CRP-like cAMP-binding protein|nr:hypothetical protein [Chitinophagaceae bacterium]
MNNLKQFIATFTELSAESWSVLTTCMTEVEFRRNELLFKEGQICNAIFYISSGFLSTTFFGKMQGIKLRAG